MLTLARGSATLLALSAVLAAGPALAQGKPLPPPATDAMPPVELTISLKDGKPVCDPAELKLPADTNVALKIVSSADAPVTITAPGQFENGLVLHADGDLVHVASEKGYMVKQNGKGTLRLRTMKAGQEEYACTSTRNADAPFKGKLVLSPPAN
ncbi:anaerobic typically selenocysteine-containing protein [Methylobacterium sp. NPDC080182]|uniref:anaerobic typically selenocysteine-containing protein n=1 Tax=Methylobacterium sp. NPDC080182 TaxID=3390590 RepID=UPI003CFDDF60